MSDRKKAGVLGATGSVGQRFILLLANHPDFELAALGASPRSAGKKYGDAVDWKQTADIPKSVADIVVTECKPEYFKECDIVFSGLEAEQADTVEIDFVNSGLNIISNAKSYRRAEGVPLVVPTANPEHLDVFKAKQDKSKGHHVCISNCSTAGLVVPMRALQDKFGPIEAAVVTTLQALSGAGFSPGVPSMDIIDNIVPYISGEEDKIEYEPRKILGTVDGVKFNIIPEREMRISATCTRVPVTDGHTASVSLKFAKQPAPSVEEIKQALREYKTEAQTLGCHSAPEHAIDVLEQPNRPQPRLDRDRGNGQTISVGRIREDPVFDIKFVGLSHNTVIGAAGSGILIAELLKAKNLI
ncbi:aspartate-semialdehyde dehydrogenase [Trichomonascus vanleenenianus]|uniref:aspartate-semialdehyde dehydrogenase n=1 Tax=Trichomonascus vanleenenianus TaxID=2268995 RepID=UPI003ECB8222